MHQSNLRVRDTLTACKPHAQTLQHHIFLFFQSDSGHVVASLLFGEFKSLFFDVEINAL